MYFSNLTIIFVLLSFRLNYSKAFIPSTVIVQCMHIFATSLVVKYNLCAC